jgi:hypothetical protein
MPTEISRHSTFRARHNIVIPTEVSRRFFFSFAPAKESAYAVEESLFDVSAHSSLLSNLQLLTSNLQNLHSHQTSRPAIRHFHAHVASQKLPLL